MKISTLFFAFAFTFASSYGQASLNMTRMSQIAFPQMSSGWGWTSPGGIEYAFVGTRDSTIIIDVTNPAAPFRVAGFSCTEPTGTITWREMKEWAGYAYIVNEHGDGLRIINMNMLPGVPAVKDTFIMGMTKGHTIAIADGYAYINGGDLDNPKGIDILDLADPWHPQYVSSYNDNYVHDCYVRDDTIYSCELSSGLVVIDVTDKNNPTVIGNKTYNGNFTHNSWLSTDGNTCFTTDEVSAAYVIAWDVTDPQNITEVDRVRGSQSGGASTPHNVHVIDNYIVTAYYADGVVVFDADRPHNLIEIAYHDIHPATGGGFPGCWGVYPYYPSGTVIATDQSEGFHIFQVDYKRACYLEGTVTDSVTTLPITNATITINATPVTDVSNNTGFYATGLPQAGSYTATYSKFGYYSKTFPVNLANGVLTIQDVKLVPIVAFAYTVTVIEAGTGTPIGFANVQAEEAGGTQINYTADAGGTVVDNAFYGGSYTFTAGKWGWRTAQVTTNANPGNTSVTITLEKGYYDDFIFDFFWQVSSTANTGAWVRGEPVGTTYNGSDFAPDLDVQNDFGDQCYVTGNGGGNPGDDDVDGGKTTLSSPVMNLTTYTDPILRCYRWFGNNGGAGAINDYYDIEVNNGINTVLLRRLTGDTHNNWVLDTFHLNAFIAITANMRIRFIAEDVPMGHLVEGAVDLFEIEDGAAVAISDQLDVSGVRLSVFPNPAGDAQSVVAYALGSELAFSPEQIFNFVLTDLSGRVVWEKTLSEKAGSFYLPATLAKGMYIGSLRSNDAVLRTFKFVK